MKIHIPIAGIKRKVLVGSLVALPLLGAGGAAYAATLHGATAGPVPAASQPAGSTVQSGDTPEPNDISDGPGTPTRAETPGTSSSEADGPGGHQDPNGSDVNHQFEGQE
jgi:hypothetical protein